MRGRSAIQTALFLLAASLLLPVFISSNSQASLRWIIVGSMALYSILYAWLLVALKDERNIDDRTQLLIAIGIRLPLFMIPVVLDGALYRALWDGWIIQANGINPFLYIPDDPGFAEFQNRPLYDYLTDSGSYATSSPLLQVIFRFLGMPFSWLSMGQMALVFKGLSIAIDIGVVYMLIRIAPLFALRPLHVLAYALNPISLFLINSQGLLDGILILIALAAVYIWRKQRFDLFSMLMGAIILVFPASSLTLPVFFKKIGLKGVLMSLATVAVWWLPFFDTAAISHVTEQLYFYWTNPAPAFPLGSLIISLSPWKWLTLAWSVILFASLLWISKREITSESPSVPVFLLVFSTAWLVGSPILNTALLALIVLMAAISETHLIKVAILSSVAGLLVILDPPALSPIVFLVASLGFWMIAGLILFFGIKKGGAAKSSPA